MKAKPRRFSDAVRRVVAGIPRGNTMTYAQVARTAGYPRAARAVGSLLSKNFDPNIPCHRVIRSDGRIGNYNRGGERAKRALLKREGAIA